MTPIQYAVALGCFNAQRLAREWGIPKGQANTILKHAAERQEIERVTRGIYAAWPSFMMEIRR